MLDINIIRENPDLVINDLKKRQALDKIPWVDAVKKADVKWREASSGIDRLRHERNKNAHVIGKIQEKEVKKRLISEMKQINEQIKELEIALKEQFDKRQYYLDRLPNIT